MTLVIKKADEKLVREFKAEAVRRGLSLSEAFEEAVRYWLSMKNKLILSDTDLNNMVYESIEKELKKHTGKYAVIAEGKLIGLFNSIEEVSKAFKEARHPIKRSIVIRIGYDDKVLGELEWLGGSIELETA